ncbi:EAL domain-containing protein [Vibrio parahaemolyticus]|nr:EAL domain-containing protein [Vibrio parahaemolyticus]ELA9569964.1 EAL domain-containing protein [Vibrio parahaemolyticus]
MQTPRLFNLNLRYKTALYFSLGLLGMIISFLFISRYFFLYSLDELENMEIDHSSQQAIAVIDMMVTQQEGSSYDWAYWDETYDLFAHRDIAGYSERNLYVETLDALNLDLMSFITLDGQSLVSLSRENTPESSSSLNNKVVSVPLLQQHILAMNSKLDVHRESLAGIFKINDNIWGLSLAPVRNSEGDRPSNGWMLWGRNLSERFPGDFKAMMSANNTLVTKSFNPVDHAKTKSIDKTSESIIKWTPISDLAGEPIAWLKTQTKREHYSKGNTLFIYLFATVGVVASVIATSTFFIFKRKVATRFSHFAEGINEIASQYQLEGLQSVKFDELELATKLVQKLSENTSMTQSQLKDSMAKFGALYHSSSLGMLIVIEREIVDANHRALELLHYKKSDILEQPLDTLCPSTNEECRVDAMYRELQNGQTQFEAQMLDSHGETIDCLIEATLIQHNGHTALMLLLQDLSENKQQAEMIQKLTDFDPVSGFCNRPVILGALEELVKHQPNHFSFIYITSKSLKQIAEVYGHLIFDEAIQYISTLLRDHLGTHQIGRISEHEFIVILPNASGHSDALEAANRLLNQLSYKIELSGIMLSLDSKAVMVDPKITHQSLEHLLLVARYSAQSMSGRHMHEVLVADGELSEQAETSMIIHRDLEVAIRQDNIIPYFQPIVNAKSGEIIGFEALARWPHPTLGIISPLIFIPLAEQGKLIVELGESILNQSCDFIGKLNTKRHSQGLPPLTVHVNLSAQHFYHSRLISFLQSMIEEHNVSAGHLVLEITESMLMGGETESIHCINEIKQLGVQLALDDFGTGYASFSSVCNFPLDIVKLDKSYVDEIETNDRAKTLVRNIANMSQELGLTIVAEGVETASQVRKLKVWNIDELQGFYFYKPMTREDAFAQFSGLPHC